LQGYVFFGTAHALITDCARDITAPEKAIHNVIVDFRRVQGLDVSAVFNLGKLEQICRQHGARLLFTDLRPSLRRQVDFAGLSGNAAILPSLDDALRMIEEEVLAEGGAGDSSGHEAGFMGLIDRALELGTPLLQPEQIPAGSAILHQGEPSDCAILLERGRLSATVNALDGRATRVATFLPGAMVGEIGLYAGTVRTATVAAEVDSTIRRIDSEMLGRLSELDPALARDFHAMIARLLARRLTRATALLHEVSR
jgi:SulP family sulfate permease